jgi:hypothetical protein
MERKIAQPIETQEGQEPQERADTAPAVEGHEDQQAAEAPEDRLRAGAGSWTVDRMRRGMLGMILILRAQEERWARLELERQEAERREKEH